MSLVGHARNQPLSETSPLPSAKHDVIPLDYC